MQELGGGRKEEKNLLGRGNSLCKGLETKNNLLDLRTYQASAAGERKQRGYWDKEGLGTQTEGPRVWGLPWQSSG